MTATRSAWSTTAPGYPTKSSNPAASAGWSPVSSPPQHISTSWGWHVEGDANRDTFPTVQAAHDRAKDIAIQQSRMIREMDVFAGTITPATAC